MHVAVIGHKDITKENLKKKMVAEGISTLVLFPSGDVEDLVSEVAKELGVNVSYDAYASGSFCGGVTRLLDSLKKNNGKLLLAVDPNNQTKQDEYILESAGVKKVSYSFI